MAFPGYGAAIAYVLSWVDKIIPTKKEALVETLQALEVKYQKALDKGMDTEAATIRVQMKELRKKAGYATE